MNRNVRFWDRVSAKYAAQPIADEESYAYKLEKTRACLSPEDEVFEFGCGTGGTAILHAPHVRHILATDISGEMLDIARQRARDAGVGNVTFEQVGIEDFDSAPGRFDAVLGLSILHLLADRGAAIAKVRSMLKPGGVFVSSTACLGDAMWFMAPIIPIARLLGFFPQVKVFTVKQLVRSLRRAGFEIEHQWQPGKTKGVFIIARKPAAAQA